MCIRGKLDGEAAYIHVPAIPSQPETEILLSYAIAGLCIGPQIVPLPTHMVASLAHGPRDGLRQRSGPVPCLPPDLNASRAACGCHSLVASSVARVRAVHPASVGAHSSASSSLLPDLPQASEKSRFHPFEASECWNRITRSAVGLGLDHWRLEFKRYSFTMLAGLAAHRTRASSS